MNYEKLEEQYFLFASNKENPQNFFQGYCFIGADYIFADEGKQKFYDDKGVRIGGGEDGCYVIAENINGEFTFSSDFSGNKKVFYYWTPSLWIVSNSIFLIAEYLKKNKVILTVNYSQLAAIGVTNRSFFNQLYSLNTFIENIKLLPTGSTLKLSKSGYAIEVLKKNDEFKTYQEGLTCFIETWIARLSGLLKNGIYVRSDLTGGADSRTVFSLLKRAAEISATPSNLPRLRSGDTLDNPRDLEIAKNIAQTYEFPINEKGTPIKNKFSGLDSFLSWKLLCLGIYHPIYFPTFGPQGDLVVLGGAGAENHRHFYKYSNSDSFIDANACKIKPSWLVYNFIADIESELKRMSSLNTKIDPVILHYREYRNRLHSGRTPQYISSFNPLGSKILDCVSEVAGSDRLKAGQINYDLMATLLPSILDIPFDSQSKDFNETRRANLTSLSKWKSVKPGKAYIGTEKLNVSTEKTFSAFDLLNAEFQNAKENQFVKDFFGKEFINKAETTMLCANESKRFSHAVEGQTVAAIIAGSLFR